MNIVLALAEDRSIVESLKASLPKTDLLLIESSVQDALRRLITIRADIVLLDDSKSLGLDALRQLVESAPGVPVVVLASTNTAETLASYTMAGARECITKPFRCEELQESLRRWTETAAQPVKPDRHAPERRGDSRSIAQHRIALRWMSRATTHFDDAPRLIQSLVDVVNDIFDPARVCALLYADGAVRIAASHGLPDSVVAGLRLNFDHGLMRRLEENTSLLDRGAGPLDPEISKEMQAGGGRIAVPLTTQGRACGALLIGEKSSGVAYTDEEKELLTVVARCASACLDRAKRYRDAARQQNRLDAVLANITAGVVTVGTDKTVTMMNESAERILQLHANEVLGRSVQKLGSSFADVVLRTMDEGKARLRQEIKDRAVNETLGLSVTPLGAEGVVAIFSILPDDRDDRDVAYSPIWKFLSNRVAQEIKNPMVAINTFAQLLPDKYHSEEFRSEFADVVQKEVERINEVVEALYEFAGHARLSLTTGDLNQSVQDILGRFDDDLRARSIRLETHFEDQTTPVSIDRPQFARAVENVIQNCIDAMPQGGTLKVTTRRDNGDCELIISDTGNGISDSDAPLVFTPFFSTKEKGMGLGLTMAGRILQEHEGRLILSSDPEGGGAFVFHLPSAETVEGE